MMFRCPPPQMSEGSAFDSQSTWQSDRYRYYTDSGLAKPRLESDLSDFDWSDLDRYPVIAAASCRM